MPKPLKDYTGRCGSCSHFSLKNKSRTLQCPAHEC
nr:MAG TPA: putative zinc-ribbon domain protein [Bacteriophage sp.]DAK73537.1 MAG TPA: putative zinc-ribbon domain protein [Caudoviricetes sp.]DAW63776.1 MAG TPA: putative zinc-ribbon domain protein [Caudoviricetes sp.]